MEDGDQLLSLINTLHALKLATVRFLTVYCVFSELIHGPTTRPLIVSFAVATGKRFRLSDSRHSRDMYPISLGLHSYLQNGGRAGLEIKVESYEGAVLGSTLHALYRYHLACSPS